MAAPAVTARAAGERKTDMMAEKRMLWSPARSTVSTGRTFQQAQAGRRHGDRNGLVSIDIARLSPIAVHQKMVESANDEVHRTAALMVTSAGIGRGCCGFSVSYWETGRAVCSDPTDRTHRGGGQRAAHLALIVVAVIVFLLAGARVVLRLV